MLRMWFRWKNKVFYSLNVSLLSFVFWFFLIIELRGVNEYDIGYIVIKWISYSLIFLCVLFNGKYYLVIIVVVFLDGVEGVEGSNEVVWKLFYRVLY